MPGPLAARRTLPVARPAAALAGIVALATALTGASCGDAATPEASPSPTAADTAGAPGDPSPSAAADDGTAGAGGVTAAAAGLAPGDTADARTVLEPVSTAVAAAGTVQGRLESDTPEGVLDADVQYDFDLPGARIAADVTGGAVPGDLGEGAVEIEGLLLPDAVYLSFDGVGDVAAPTPWVRIGTDGAEGVGANPFAGIEDTLDATQIVESLDPGTVLTYEGTETVGGTEADHWSLDADPAEADGLDRVDYWITAEELPVRFATVIAGPEGGDQGEVKVDYEQWGAPVDLAPPPDSEVTDLSGVAIP